MKVQGRLMQRASLKSTRFSQKKVQILFQQTSYSSLRTTDLEISRVWIRSGHSFWVFQFSQSVEQKNHHPVVQRLHVIWKYSPQPFQTKISVKSHQLLKLIMLLGSQRPNELILINVSISNEVVNQEKKYVKICLTRLISPSFLVKMYVTHGGLSPSNWHLQQGPPCVTCILTRNDEDINLIR